MADAVQGSRLLVQGGYVVNVFSGEIYQADVLCVAGAIVHVASPGSLPQLAGDQVIQARGKYVLPCLVNAHLHIESSMVTPSQYAAAVVPHGTLTLVADPHEIANVTGVAGIRALAEDAAGAVADVFFLAPSCVPATSLETAGAELGLAEVEALLAEPHILGLGEVMNYPAVVAGEPAIMGKIAAARRARKPVDGHAPGLSGGDLARYVAAGVSSEHESTTFSEAREKYRLGMWLMIRQGSAARNLDALLPLARAAHGERMMFVTDDRTPDDLLAHGELDDILRQAVAGGLDPVEALRMATLSPAAYFGLADRGAIVPGRLADLWIVDDLREFRTAAVVRRGSLLWADGDWVAGASRAPRAHRNHARATDLLAGSVHLPPALPDLLAFPARSGAARVIGVVPGQITTRHLRWPVTVDAAGTPTSPEGELCWLAVVERHGRNGNIGVGLVTGLGLGKALGAPVRHNGRHVAIAATVAHDSHNLVVAGSSREAMLLAAQALAGAGGGFTVVSGGEVKALLALPVAGLMSEEDAATVAAGLARVNAAGRALGMMGESPLMTLSFLALPVIPELKLTDRGLVDVTRFCHVPLWVE